MLEAGQELKVGSKFTLDGKTYTVDAIDAYREYQGKQYLDLVTFKDDEGNIQAADVGWLEEHVQCA